MSSFVFITGALTNADKETRGLYQKIAKMIKPYATKVYKPGDEKFSTSQGRYQRGMERVKNSDLIIAVVNYPSTGQGFELQEAFRLKVPVIAVAKMGLKTSSMITGAPFTSFIYYQNEKDLKEKLTKELGRYSR
jgi:nucleoside 2-deoxyribosyltransferase